MELRKIVRELKNLSYDEIEILVREATSNEPEGAPVSLMDQIAKATYDPNLFNKLFTQLWKRLTDVEQYLHVNKALSLVNHLLRAGDKRFVEEVRRRSRDVFRLRKYRYFNTDGQNIAADANLKATEIMELLDDRSKLRKARKKKQGKNYSPEEEKEELKKEIEERKAKQLEAKKKEEQEEEGQEEEVEEEEEEAPTEVREHIKEEKTVKKTTNAPKRQTSSSSLNNINNSLPTSPKARPSSSSSASMTGPSASSSSSSDFVLSDEERAQYIHYFDTADVDQDGVVSGKEAQAFFSKTTLHSSILSAISTLSDIDGDGTLNKEEFAVAMFFSVRARRNVLLPMTLPDSLDYRKHGAGDFDALLMAPPPDPGLKVLKANIILGRSRTEELKKEKEEVNKQKEEMIRQMDDKLKQVDEKIAKQLEQITTFEQDLKVKKEEEAKKKLEEEKE